MRTAAGFGSEPLFADGAQSPLFLAQDFPDFFVGDLSLAKPLNHVPHLGAVLVGPFMKGVRRTRKDWIWFHGRGIVGCNRSSNY
jgi:hypothetical protein